MLTRGWEMDDGINTLDFFRRIMVVEIPVLLKLTLPAGKFKASLFAGPEVMIHVGEANWWYELDGTDTNTGEDYEDITNPFWGLALGGEIDIPVSEKMFFIVDVRYVIMFSSIFDENIYGYDISMNSLKFMAGIGMSM